MGPDGLCKSIASPNPTTPTGFRRHPTRSLLARYETFDEPTSVPLKDSANDSWAFELSLIREVDSVRNKQAAVGEAKDQGLSVSRNGCDVLGQLAARGGLAGSVA